MFDVNKIRNDFPMFKNNPDLIYFDSAATSFKPQCVIDAINDYYSCGTCNIHRGDYDLSYRISNEYDKVRDKVANFLNAKSANEIIFTAGDSASLNQIAFGYLMKEVNEGDCIITTLLEHASNILPLFKVCQNKKAELLYSELKDDGHFDLNKYEELFKNHRVKAVVVTAVSNVLGYLNPLKEICSLAHKYGAVVILDGAQAVPHFPFEVQDIDCDFLAFSAHKMIGPTGLGILYGKYELLEKMDPCQYGGGANARFDKDMSLILQDIPARFEAGTPNIANVLGFGAAIDYLNNLGMADIAKYEHDLALYLHQRLKELDNIEVYNSLSDCVVAAFNVKGIFAQDAASYLNKNNIAVRSGNHCAKVLHHVIGCNETIRASLSFYNTKEEIDYLINVLKDITLEKCIGAVI